MPSLLTPLTGPDVVAIGALSVPVAGVASWAAVESSSSGRVVASADAAEVASKVRRESVRMSNRPGNIDLEDPLYGSNGSKEVCAT